MESLKSLFARFGFPDLGLPEKIAGDLSLLFLFIGVSLVFGFVFGRYRLINILVSVYIAIAVIAVLPEPWLEFSEYGRVIAFLGMLFGLTLVDQRLFDLHMSNAGTDFFWRLIVTSILVTGLIASTILSSLPKEVALDYLSVVAYGYLASPVAILFWTVFPIFALLFINKRLR